MSRKTPFPNQKTKMTHVTHDTYDTLNFLKNRRNIREPQENICNFAPETKQKSSDGKERQ